MMKIPAAIRQGCGGCTESESGPVAADIAYPHRRPEINNRACVLKLARLWQAMRSQPFGLSIAATLVAILTGSRLLTIGHCMYRREMECRDRKRVCVRILGIIWGGQGGSAAGGDQPQAGAGVLTLACRGKGQPRRGFSLGPAACPWG